MPKVNFSKLHLSNTDADFEAAIEVLGKRTDTLQLDIHRFLIAVANRWHETGDVRPAVKFTNLLLARLDKSGVRRNAIMSWVEECFGFVFNGETKEFVSGKVKGKHLDVETLRNVRWWEFKPEPEFKPVNAQEEFLKIYVKLAKRAEKGNEEDVIDPLLMQHVKAALETYEAERAQLAADAAAEMAEAA